MSSFAGFTPELYSFLDDLRHDNDREWFKRNEGRYDAAVRGPALALIEAMKPRLAAISPHLVASPKKVGGSLMRIHRDVRFSADKSPYKTNLGIQFRHAAGKDVHAPGLYVHAEPGESFIGAGMWHPASEPLSRVREAIDRRPDAWRAARDDPAFAARWRLEGDALKRPPQGYAADHPLIEDLKRKDFIAVRRLAPEDVLGPDLPDRLAADFGAAAGFMRFLSEAVGLDF